MTDWDDSEVFEAAEKRTLSQMAMGARAVPYLDGLNPAQREAVETLQGPVLMLAGAGTGKTKALTTRIAHLLHTRTARPNEVLAVTFTNKAAREMKNRVGGLLGEMVEGMPWMGTFHSLCAKILRRHAELVGLKSNFTILDMDDQLRLLKQLLRADNIDEKRWPARMLAGLIDNWKNRAWTPANVPSSEASEFNMRGTEFYALYQTRLRTLNATDFGDLLLHVVTIFQAYPDVLRKYQGWFKYILVDEYQDTNVAQYLWLRLLAAEHKNICCVGDDDQSIYGWRGAEVGNILRFEKDFPGAHVVRLEQNYRSTEHILAGASAIIDGNKNRLGKTLWTAKKGGEKIRLANHQDGQEEARWVGEEIENFQRGTRGHDPVSLDDMAILVRASHQMRAFEDRFLSIGMPYRVIGGPRFYERMEIRDAMAYFRVAISNDDALAFERIVNTPKRGIGEKAQQLINQTAREHDVSLVQGARILVDACGLSTRARGALKTLLDGIDRWSAAIRDGVLGHVEIAEIILDESGYTDYWKNNKTPEAEGRLENLKELIKALEEFENLQGFLEHISLIMDNAQEDAAEKVSIMTLHAAKGLEFPAVFLVGWEEGLFPSQRSMDEAGQSGLEEERRLAYVGITRAEKFCAISFVNSRFVFGQWQSSLPSRFIDELPHDHVDVLTASGQYSHSGGYGMDGDSALMDKIARADTYNSPGYRRMQSRIAQPGKPVRKPKTLIIDAEPVADFTIGDRCSHVKYGLGTVIGVESDKLSIVFDNGGAKKVLASFINPESNFIPPDSDPDSDVPF